MSSQFTYSLLPHEETGVPSKVMKDLLAGGTFLESIAKPPYHWESFEAQADAQGNYSPEIREIVAKSFERQNAHLTPSESASIAAFRNGALSITTGHQLMVCGGTVFFEAKVLGAVALAKAVTQALGRAVIPIFWMATEDHDFEEISSFRIGQHKFIWEHPEAEGSVGLLPTSGLASQLEDWLKSVPLNEAQKKLLQPRLRAYSECENLAEATRQWVRQWAEGLGLLVLDGQDANLKEAAGALWSAEMDGDYSELIHKQTEALVSNGYQAQVFPREINLFDLRDGGRKRFEQADYQCPSLQISPNALMRPLYQEFLLPNLAYVGGGGELAYWLQLGEAFKKMDRPMPVLYLRDSLFIQNAKLQRALDKIGQPLSAILNHSAEDLKKQFIASDLSLQAEGEALQLPLETAINDWNSSLQAAYPELKQHAEALRVKMMKLAQRTAETRYRAQKRRHSEVMTAIDTAYAAVYPEGSFWERRASYADLVGSLGVDPRDEIVEKMSAIKAGTWVLSSKK